MHHADTERRPANEHVDVIGRVGAALRSEWFWERYVPADLREQQPDIDDADSWRAPFPFFPALEGLRGGAVLAVLVAEGRFAVGRGGSLAASTLLTVSGFLLVSRLYADQRLTGTLDVFAYWTRRLRSVLPPMLVALGLASAFVAASAAAGPRSRFAVDVAASVGFVANWRFVGEPAPDALSSPLLPMWYPAVLAQFLLIVPLTLLPVLRRVRWPRRSFVGVLVAVLLVSFAAGVLGGRPAGPAALATGSRTAAVAVGALLAVALAGQRVRHLAAGTASEGPVLAASGGLAMLLGFVVWLTAPDPASWFDRGGFIVYSLLTAAVIAGALVNDSPVAKVLAWPPLRAVGRIWFGVYLYHWVVFQWVDSSTTGFVGAGLWVYRVVVTIGLAWLSYTYFEAPIRRGSHSGVVRIAASARGAAACAAVLVALAIALSLTSG